MRRRSQHAPSIADRPRRPSAASFSRCARTFSRAAGISRRLETIIDGFGDRLHGPVAGLERRDHLPLALPPMLDGRTDQRRADRRRAGRAPETAGAARARARAGATRDTASDCRRGSPSIITLPPAMTRSPVKHGARRLVPERDVIGRVPGRVHDRQRRRRRRAISLAVDRAAASRWPCGRHRPAQGISRTAVRGCARAMRGDAGRVIRMAVCHEHRRGATLVRRRAPLERGQMTPDGRRRRRRARRRPR